MTLDWRPVRPDLGEWPASNPTSQSADTYAFIPDGAVSDSHISDVSATKVRTFGIKVYRSTAQSIPDDVTTNITMDTVVFNQGFASPGASFTSVAVPRAGLYLIVASSAWATNATGNRRTHIMLNGVAAERDRRATSGETPVTVTAGRLLDAGDTVGISGHQTSGAALNFGGTAEDDSSLTVILLGTV
jgi:hypothetical protein